jgi:hypothetical protein
MTYDDAKPLENRRVRWQTDSAGPPDIPTGGTAPALVVQVTRESITLEVIAYPKGEVQRLTVPLGRMVSMTLPD